MVIKTGVFSISIGILRLLLMLCRLIFPNVIISSSNIKSLPERTSANPDFQSFIVGESSLDELLCDNMANATENQKASASIAWTSLS